MKTYRRKELMSILGVNSRQIDSVTRSLGLNKNRLKLGRGKRIAYTEKDLSNFHDYFVAYKIYLDALNTVRSKYGIDAHGNE